MQHPPALDVPCRWGVARKFFRAGSAARVGRSRRTIGRSVGRKERSVGQAAVVVEVEGEQDRQDV